MHSRSSPKIALWAREPAALMKLEKGALDECQAVSQTLQRLAVRHGNCSPTKT